MTEYQRKQVEMKYELIQKALADHGQNKSRAAIALGIDRKTLYNVINNYQSIKKAG